MKSQKSARDLICFTTFSLLIAISPLSASQSCSNGVEIICSANEEFYWSETGGSLPTCKVDESIRSTFSDASVSSVVHSNGSKVTNLDEITGIIIAKDKEVKFIPSGIGRHFPNLKLFYVHNCGLLSVNKGDLQQFGKSLKYLDLAYNMLISIEADLFEYSPNLKLIYLSYNPIRYIEPEFFVNLKSLKNIERISLWNTNCVDQVFNIKDNHDIATYVWNYENCTESTAKDEAKNLIGEYRSNCSHGEFSQERDDHVIIIKNDNEKSASNINQENKSINKNNIEALDKKLEKLINLQEKHTKEIYEKIDKNAEKLEKFIIILSSKMARIQFENDEMRKSIDNIKQQMTAESEKMLKLLEYMEKIK